MESSQSENLSEARLAVPLLAGISRKLFCIAAQTIKRFASPYLGLGSLPQSLPSESKRAGVQGICGDLTKKEFLEHNNHCGVACVVSKSREGRSSVFPRKPCKRFDLRQAFKSFPCQFLRRDPDI